MTISVAAIHFYYGSVIISRKQLKHSYVKYNMFISLKKTLENGLDQFSLCSYKACRSITYWFHIKSCEIKQTVTFEWLVE